MVRSAAAVLALSLFPALAPAQQSGDRTHTVVGGNTLWSLAQTYYGDPYGWTRIFEANRDRLRDPDLLEPGLVLRVPAATGGPAAIEGPAATEGPTRIEGPTPEAVEAGGVVRGVAVIPGGRATGSASSREVAREVAPDVAPDPVERPSTRRRTSFYSEPPSERAATTPADEAPVLSEGDVHRSPWLAPPRGIPEEAGTVQGLASEGAVRLAARPFDEVRVTFGGPVPSVGTRLQTFRAGPEIPDVGQVVVPTGTLVVTETGPDGAVARVADVYARLAPGDRVRALPEVSLPPGTVSRPEAAAGRREAPGPRATVIGFPDVRGLHGPGDYAFLGGGSAVDFRVGDLLEVVLDGHPDGDPYGDPHGDRDGDRDGRGGGSLQVVSIQDGYSTARIVAVENSVFAPGVEVRLSRRMR